MISSIRCTGKVPSLRRSLTRFLHSNVQLYSHQNPLGIPKPTVDVPKGSRKVPPPGIPRMSRGLPTKVPIAGVKHIVAVASGKGGVGKSTTAVNLAVALAGKNLAVGLLDADLYGPSIPRMMNLLGAEPDMNQIGQLKPLFNYGVKSMSMGFLVDPDSPVVWRGLMVMKALEQMLRQVDWSNTDILVIDMPPGTGDTQLTITQQVPLDGAVIVSTPQDVALGDARKGISMFQTVNVPILGMVQNMSLFHCPNCGHESHIFGTGGVASTAKEFGVDLLADVPLHADVCATSDAGTPIVISMPDGVHALAYKALADSVMEKIDSAKKI
ncbi:P-loop containing nucleoside triphosphate hydrolase protein [Phlyctochytrium arcticum]|nr:P-loop containing nucleoside triphosphate hydrolase protein [Phlyctochytrium arcticum]